MDEKKLEGYKLKKLKSQFVYLRDVLQENQYIYELALEKFYQDFTEPLSDEKVQKAVMKRCATERTVLDHKTVKLQTKSTPPAHSH